jgi:hypothetical protein
MSFYFYRAVDAECFGLFPRIGLGLLLTLAVFVDLGVLAMLVLLIVRLLSMAA